MKVIKGNNYFLFPIAYEEFCNDLNSIPNLAKGSNPISVTRMLNANHLLEISKIIHEQKDTKILFVIDMSNIDSIGDRILGQYLKGIDNIVIANVQKTDNLVCRIKEDLNYIEEDRNFFNNKDTKSDFDKIKKEVENIYHMLDCDITRKITFPVLEKDIDDIKPMDSSNIYCNMYVNVAKLFIYPEYYRYIIYRLICKINKKISDLSQVDAFVSASRTGANLANILAWLLGKKSIFCVNIGPKFSLSTQYLLDEIRQQNNYVYIYDFMCLGTESKLLNAILSVKKAELFAGFGIATYIREGNVDFFDKMYALVDVRKENFGYNVIGEKEDLKKILINKSGEEYGLQLYEL